jgi:hypothetical protein
MSTSRVSAITNREAFLGMYLFDVWANHQDNRQAIFRRSSTNDQEVWFIDRGRMFGGPQWTFKAVKVILVPPFIWRWQSIQIFGKMNK